MKQYQIAYRTASGKTSLTRTIVAKNAEEALKHCTDFVRKNMLQIYEVPENHVL